MEYTDKEHKACNSIILINNTGEKKNVLYAYYLLELCGYCVMEQESEDINTSDIDMDNNSDNSNYAKIVLKNDGAGNKCENNSYIEVDILDKYSSTWLYNIIELLVENEEERSCIKHIINFYYTDEILSGIYTVKYVYSSESRNKNKELMLQMIKEMRKIYKMQAEELNNKRKRGKLNWRELYYQVYIENIMNLGMSEIQGQVFRPYSDFIEKNIEELRDITNDQEIIDLLNAESFEYSSGGPRKEMIRLYNKILEKSKSTCIRYRALEGLARVNKYIAKQLYSEVYEDNDCSIMVKYNEKFIQYYRRILDIKPDDLEALFNVGLQQERMDKCEEGNLHDNIHYARNTFKKMEKIIETKRIEERTLDDFKYLYISYVRLTVINYTIGKMFEASEYFSKAKEVWGTLINYPVMDSEILKVIENTYSNKDDTLEKLQNMLNRGDELKETDWN